MTVPYFDSNLDYHLGDDLAAQTVTWTADFAGNGDGVVTTGPFARWTLPFPLRNRRLLFRNLTHAPRGRTLPALMSDEALQTILNARSLRDICWNIDSSFETFHGATHNWVGGVMVNLPVSPSDPVFFLHHSFVDCLFTGMRDNQRARGINVNYDYPNDTVAMGVGMRRQGDGVRIRRPDDSFHYALNEMRPFGPLRNIDGLSDVYENTVRCAPRPTCSRADTSCGGSGYLFCDESTYRCAPKLRLGAQCGRHARYSPCSGGECCNGVCQEYCGTRTQNRVNQGQRNRDRRPETTRPRNVQNRREMVETMHGTDNDRPEPPTHAHTQVPAQSRVPETRNRERFRPSEEIPEPRPGPDRQEPESVEDGQVARQRPSPRHPDVDRSNLGRENEDFTTDHVFPDEPDGNAEQDLRNEDLLHVNVDFPREEEERRDPDPPPRRFREQLPQPPRDAEDSFENPSSNRNVVHGLGDAYRAHPGVPTHAPYVVPTLPPVPTHAPYVVPRVPTHAPGYDAIPQPPTHPPSYFENYANPSFDSEEDRLYDAAQA